MREPTVPWDGPPLGFWKDDLVNRGPFKPSVPQLLAVALLLAAGIIVWTTVVLWGTTRSSLLIASRTQRKERATDAAHRVEDFIHTAERALGEIDVALKSGLVPAEDLGRLEELLYGEVVNHPMLEEATVTRASFLGYDQNGRARLGEHRVRLSVCRLRSGSLVTKLSQAEGETFYSGYREHPSGKFSRQPLQPSGSGSDPTAHPTFWVLARERNLGRTLWSDLHFSELDEGKTSRPRVVLSVQRAWREPGRALPQESAFLDVVRVGLSTDSLETIAAALNKESEPHHIAIFAAESQADEPARLVVRTGPADEIVEGEEDLRVRAVAPSVELAQLLESPLLRQVSPEHPELEATLDVSGKAHLVTFQPLAIGEGGTRGWFLSVVVPEEHYTRALAAFGRRLGTFYGLALVGLAIAAGAVLYVLGRGLRQVEHSTEKMRRFDFSPQPDKSALREVSQILQSVDRAKTVARTMSKYLPLALVRQQFEANEEARLGGQYAELTLLFTDIQGFASLSEGLAPSELARYLGLYLETATHAIQATGGTIDKYIGDAVMAFWNAPQAQADHAARACQAALDVQAALDTLYASPEWHPLRPLVTRFGLHTDRVLVGHFGAPSRLSYTALGDGVNLAARLEPLGKQYGVTLLVSRSCVAQAGDQFAFRRVDRVAVKGKQRGVEIYELLGRGIGVVSEVHRRYERALELYWDRDFAGALTLLSEAEDDGPSRIITERCRSYLREPPPADWDGVFVAKEK